MKSVGVAVIAMLLLCGTVYAERTIWYVHPDSILNTIQAGLDYCADNDIVLVGSGTYYENIVWPNTQGIHLISELGPENTIIDGDSTGRVIRITCGVDSLTIIRGFTIQNGYDTLCGGGIHCDSSSSPIIASNNITENIAYRGMAESYGGGISCIASAPIIRSNTIMNNRATEGGGIYCASSSSPIIAGNTIIGNTASGICADGGGIACSYSSPNINSNIISDNKSYGAMSADGGGISCYYSSPTISGNTISGNEWDGIFCKYSSSPSIIGNTISGHANYGIFCRDSSSPTVIHNIVTGNGTSLFTYYGGIHCIDNSSPIIDSCTISSNLPNGIICGSNATPTIHYCNINNNIGYGILNTDANVAVNATHNWWGDSTGPYHPTANPGGLGDSVSDYVDFDPWLSWPVGVEERPRVKPVGTSTNLGATIFGGPLQLPEGKKFKAFDITGRVVEPTKIQPGIYFIEVDGFVTQKVVKVR